MAATLSYRESDQALSLARQALYRFTAMALVDPRAGTWRQLSDLRTDPLLDAAAAVVRHDPAAKADTLALGERPLEDLDPAAVLKRLPATAAELNGEYERTFGLLVGSACPPYETEYIHGKFTFQRSQTLADVSGFYRAFGLKPSDWFPERHDHIVQELEFMALLLGLERRAADSQAADRHERIEVCRDAQLRFFREHLVWWAPAFARLLARENAGGFYAAVGNFLAALMAAERSLLGVEPPVAGAAPSTLEPPDACDGCQLAEAAEFA